MIPRPHMLKTGVFATRDELEAEVVRLRGDGMTFWDIALAVGVGEGTCWLIAIARGAHTSSLCGDGNTRNPPEVVAEVLRLRCDNVTFQEIARRCGMSKNRAMRTRDGAGRR